MHDTTEHFSDETLMAYADGELDGEAARRLERALAASEALRQRLQMFVRTGRCIAQAFDNPLASEPAPALHRRSAGKIHRRGWHEGLRDARGWLLAGSGYRVAGAAAVVLLAAGLAVAVATLTPDPRGSTLVSSSADGRLVAAGRLLAALESGESRGFAPVSSREPYAVQTFRNREGAFCREYAAPKAASRGVACRTADGRWLIALQTSATAPANGDRGFVPAGSPKDQLIDGFVHEIMQGNPLAADQEKRVIANGWRD